jgi:hypothetical protein
MKNFLFTVSLVLISFFVPACDRVSARGLATTVTPGLHHTNIPVRHRSAHRTRQHSTSSRNRERTVTQYLGRKRREVLVTSHHARQHKTKHHRVRHVAASRHAYPMNFFMLKAPEFDRTPLPTELSQRIHNQFVQGTADGFSPRALVRAGIVGYFPMRGGIFWRREPVKYIVVHSTETGRPMGATRVIDSWSSGGRRHAGAQYVVDRDGSIFQAVDPDLATVHVNIFKTLPGINNDNTVGIEMCHAGSQNYPTELRESVLRLVTYLQERYKVADENIITHRYAQQGDHTDPVAFDFNGFLLQQKRFHMQAVASRMNKANEELARLTPDSGLQATVYMQPHGALSEKQPAATEQANPAESTTIIQESKVSGKVVNTVQSAPAEQPEQAMHSSSTKQRLQPALRGPIEMDPQSATIFNAPAQPAEPTQETAPNH